MELYEELDYKNRQLDQAIKVLRKNGTELAKAESEYKEELTKEVLRLRDEGMAVTLINLIIYGQPSVSTLRLKRDIAKTTYEANAEVINILKLQIRIIEAQLQREYEVAGRNI